jgi:hypothetical protein
MFVCCKCCGFSGRGLCNGLITRPEESYRLWCVVVCDQEISKTRRLKPATGLWKIQTQWVVRAGKQQQTTNNPNVINRIGSVLKASCSYFGQLHRKFKMLWNNDGSFLIKFSCSHTKKILKIIFITNT